MSKSGRRPFDFYETPPHYLRALRDVIGDIRTTAFEPCVGDGCIVRAFPHAQWTTNDWDRRRSANTHHNAARSSMWGVLGYQWCITNPPFGSEQAILRNALQWCKNVAFLARLSFLEPTLTRQDFWKRFGDRVTIIVLPRYSFTGDGSSDNQTCVWLVWWELQRTTGRVYFSDRRRMTDGAHR